MKKAISTEFAHRINEVEKYGKKSAAKTIYLKYLNGDTLSPTQALKAHCYECMGYYADGNIDCEMPLCSLHPFMPYNKDKKKKHTKIMTEEQKDQLRARFAKSRVEKAKQNVKISSKHDNIIEKKDKTNTKHQKLPKQ
jgi:hypothetical protein